MNLVIALMIVVLTSQTVLAEDPVTITEAKPDENGFLVHVVRSPYQSNPTQIRVLLPDKLEQGRMYPVVYVLPVEAGTGNRFGDGLKEVRQLDLHNAYHAVFISPTFSQLPWYADHPTKSELRQEAYLLDVVLPFIERTYPVQADLNGRLLLGFSKSGWGAWSLLLRHPDLFYKAAAWDAPLMMDKPGKYGSGDIFGSADNFERYQITKLLQDHADQIREGRRLVLLGYGNFRSEHQQIKVLLDQLQIACEYRDGPARKHDWHSGWVRDAALLLLADQQGVPGRE